MFFFPWINLYKLFTWIYLYDIMFDIFLHYTNLAFNKGVGSRRFHTFFICCVWKKRGLIVFFLALRHLSMKGNQLLHERLPNY